MKGPRERGSERQSEKEIERQIERERKKVEIHRQKVKEVEEARHIEEIRGGGEGGWSYKSKK